MKEEMRRLQEVDWGFSDYRGFSSLPADINSLHWHPAPFLPQIPAILIQVLTNEGDTILDPFAGAGVALIEAAKLKRKFVGIDINPHAVDIMRAKFHALSIADHNWFSLIQQQLNHLPHIGSVDDYCNKVGIDREAYRWFEERTLSELCNLHKYVQEEKDEKNHLLKKTIFSSILQSSCSQRDHYTYVTDGCYPKLLRYFDAISLFLRRAELTAIGAEKFRTQYRLMHEEEWSGGEGVISLGDARRIDFLDNGSIDMVVTSPPYLGVNDYVRSMRLSRLFFPEPNIEIAMENEIGARWKRNRKLAYQEYVDDMTKSFSEISRVLTRSGAFCLTVGQSRSRASKNNIVGGLLRILKNKFGFRTRMRTSRQIIHRRIQVAGVGKEDIIVLDRRSG